MLFITPGNAKIDPETAVGIWLFDEGKSDVAGDASGKGNDGTLKNEPQWVDGKFGKALEFDGQDDSIEIPDSDSLNDVDDLTMVSWVYLNREVTSGTWNALVGKKPYQNGYLMWIEVPKEPCGLVYVGGARFDNRAGVQIDLDKWYHLAFTRVHKGEMKFFINGSLVKVGTSSSGVISTQPAPISIAGQSPQVLDGIVDDVAIFNVALTEDEINDIMTKGLDRTLSITAVKTADKLTTTWGRLRSGKL
jgi:hypothetical protein